LSPGVVTFTFFFFKKIYFFVFFYLKYIRIRKFNKSSGQGHLEVR